MDWGNFLTTTAQDLIGVKADQMVTPVSAPPVSQTSAGLKYTEGKPSLAVTLGSDAIFGLPKMIVYGGAAALLLGGFLMLRGK